MALQVPLLFVQLILPSVLFTVPWPDSLTVSVFWGAVKLAVAVTLALTTTVHEELLPLHEPPHPPNVQLLAGLSFNVTDVPLG